MRREGEGVTILGWLLMVHFAIEAGEQTGAEVVDMRSLSPIDWATIGTSVSKTGRVLVVEEGPKTGGVGAEIAAGIAERHPGVLVSRLASVDVQVPFSPVLENAYRPDVDRIVDAVRELEARRWNGRKSTS